MRLAHYPHNEEMAKLADELGLLFVGGNSGLLGNSF